MTRQGHSSAHIDGSSPSEYRKDVVDKFRSGEIQMVFNYGVFTARFDAPKIDAVVIARPTTSVVLYGQMMGRGMRGSAIGETERFQLIDVVDGGCCRIHIRQPPPVSRSLRRTPDGLIPRSSTRLPCRVQTVF